MREASCTDKELIQAFGRGDDRAGRALAERYYPRVLNLCRYQLGTRDDALDAAQDVFLMVLGRRKILAFRGQGKLWTWLYRVTVNACYHRLRQRLWWHLPNPRWNKNEAFEELLADAALSPEDQAVLREELERMARMIFRLPGRYRAALVLVCLRGYTYAEAADELEISVPTLGVWLNRAKRILTQRMRQLRMDEKR